MGAKTLIRSMTSFHFVDGENIYWRKETMPLNGLPSTYVG
jgi:hypothetical protein